MIKVVKNMPRHKLLLINNLSHRTNCSYSKFWKTCPKYRQTNQVGLFASEINEGGDYQFGRLEGLCQKHRRQDHYPKDNSQ